MMIMIDYDSSDDDSDDDAEDCDDDYDDDDERQRGDATNRDE